MRCVRFGNKEQSHFVSLGVPNGLELILDQGPAPVTHGTIAPVQVVPLTQYQTDLENTRAAWQIDET